MEKKYEDKKKEIIHLADNIKRKAVSLMKKIKHYNKHYRRQAVNSLNEISYEATPRMIYLIDMLEKAEKKLDEEVKK